MTDTAEQSAERPTRKERVGVVVSDVRDKTITVTVERRTTHGLYSKTLSRTKKLTVHDETNDANVGDTVRVVETRPISKTKRWRLAEVVERAK